MQLVATGTAIANWAAAHWFSVKTFVEHSIAFSDDVLHAMVGVLLQLIFARLLATDIGNARPWGVVLLLEVANEWSDFHHERWPVPSMQWGESAKDVLLTMALPTVLLIVSRHLPGLLVRNAQTTAARNPEG